MSLETSIKEICGNLKSNKITERKKNAEALKDYLTRNAVPDLLSDNTRKKIGFTWNDLFDSVSDYFLKETEKHESSKTFHNVTYPLCTSLLHLSVAGSNKGRAYIKCEKIMEACLFVLQNKILANVIGDAYLTLLYKYVLPNENYASLITPNTWENLLDICVTNCISNVSELDDFIKLKILWLVIKNAGEYCQFSLSLRSYLSNISEYFYKVHTSKKILEVVIDISILILDMLYLENRLSVCEFIEQNLPLIFEFYEQNLDGKKKMQLFKLLNTSIIIHHPLGRTENEESAHAHNWNAWNKSLEHIMDLVSEEINYLQKHNRQSNNTMTVCPVFAKVAAYTYFLIFKKLAPDTESNYGIENCTKKPRIAFNECKNFTDLLQELQRNYMPWISIVQMYIKHFGNYVSVVDYECLVQIIEELVKNNDFRKIGRAYQSLVCSVLKKNILCDESKMKNNSKVIITSLWNSCVRNSTNTVSYAHEAIHSVMQSILSLNILDNDSVNPLLALYFEKGVPVSDSSVITLCMLLKIFYTKCCHSVARMKCLKWFINGQITCVNVMNVRQLFLLLLSNENISDYGDYEYSKSDNLYDILFETVDKSILYNDLEYEIIQHEQRSVPKTPNLEINNEVNTYLLKYLQGRLSEYTTDSLKKGQELIECLKMLNLVLVYLNVTLKYNFRNTGSTELLLTFNRVLEMMYTASIHTLKSDVPIRDKNLLLHYLQLMLLEDYHTMLNSKIRLCIDKDIFHCINNILNNDIPTDEDDCDSDMSLNVLKHNCIYFLAAFCKKNHEYKDELLELILSPRLYNFGCNWDTESALKCIRLLNQSDIEDAPIELSFALMQSMCKDLFRNSKSTLRILQTLLEIVDKVWMHSENLRCNCVIMVKGYLHRCENMYYPPQVAVLVYECLAKIISLNCKENCPIEIPFKDVIMEKMKGNVHSIRLYCNYLIKSISEVISEEDIESHLINLKDIFTIVVSADKEMVLKDELKNRTSAVLHVYVVMVLSKPLWIHRIVLEILCLQQEKSLDKRLVKKVLHIIITKSTQRNIDFYFEQHILLVLQWWLQKKKRSLRHLPLCLLGSESIVLILAKHMKWFVSADILWGQHGVVQISDMLQRFKQDMTEEAIIEKCFCNILILSLPYIVNEKYQLGINYELSCKESVNAASRMFHQMRQYLKNEKWTKLFIENMDQLVLLTALHLKDFTDTKKMLAVDVPQSIELYSYSKEVFVGILKYFGELIDGNIMEYFCENQPLALFKVLFTLWNNVLFETNFHFKAILIHSFITFIENIPLGFPSDAFICNYTCAGIASALKQSHSKEQISVLLRALLVILKHFSSLKVFHKDILSDILTILMTQKDYNSDCNVILSFVVNHLMNIDNDLKDLYDIMTEVEVETCLSEVTFLEKIQKYELNLKYLSVNTLYNISKFLRAHKKFLRTMLDKLDVKGFSEECERSAIHKFIVGLCNILATSGDNQMVVAASNCLAEIGAYDLKTLITVPPKDTTQLMNVKPTVYFTLTVVKSLLDILFDDNPSVSDKAVKTLYHLMTFNDGKIINIGSRVVDSQILKCLMSSTCESFAQFTAKRTTKQWSPLTGEDYFKWITRITVDILDILESPLNYLCSLRELCILKPSLAQKIMPSLVGFLLEYSSEDEILMIGQQINEVFNYFWSKSFNDNKMNSSDSTVSKILNILDDNQKMIVHCMLDVVNTYRLQRNHLKMRKLRVGDTLRCMKLEYEKLAWAATLVDKNIVAVYYAELWAVAENGDVPPSNSEITANLHNGENVQKILRNCFVSIGEFDAADGCGTAHLISEEEKRKHLLNTGQYADALLLHDIALSHGNQIDKRLQRGVVMSLYKSRMHHLALQYIKSYPENDELNDVKYDCLSHLGDWSEIVDTKELEEKAKQSNWNADTVIKSFRYACLKECLNADPHHGLCTRLTQLMNSAKLAVSKLCHILNMENCQSIYKVVGNLHLLGDIQDYCSVRCGETSLSQLLTRWKIENLPPFKDFRHIEILLSQRNLILEHAAKQYGNLLSDVIDLQLHYVDMGLSNGKVQMAQRLIESVKKLMITDKVALAESQIAWAKGHVDIALALLHGIVSDHASDDQLGAMSLRQYGLWMAECKRENARDIINKYLGKSLEILDQHDHSKTRFKIYHDIAKFADSEYKQIVSYMNSSVFENKVKCIENMKGTAASLKVSQLSLTKDERKALLTNDRFMQLDEAEVSNTRAEKDSFLSLALRYYLLSLRYCEENNLSIFRVISLWFDNPEFKFDNESETNLKGFLEAIPSWKFITVLPQLAPRLSKEDNEFSSCLKRILARCAVEHPHHTLPILFNLKNSDKDNCILKASKSLGPGSTVERSHEPRVVAAEALVRELAQESNLVHVISQMDRMCDAFISFAYFAPKVNNMKPQPIPTAEPLSKLCDLYAVPIPTVNVAISKNGDYSTLANITAFEKYFELVGGINYPKKITCRSSDGQSKILLIKGEDDLRQDAVMQQVFNIVNTLLENNPITKKNKLLIRTYKVVPMSRRSGVLGWCEGTMPLGTYLVEAHTRCRPKDIPPAAARTKLKSCHDCRKSNQEKLRVFMEILANFKPVFHNFFTEHYHDPITWYERRLAYIRSVATSSMVGYILGLGDRHVQNILIDKNTAEVIHIDFGIAFDQGKALPTPETVPFRLTQDIIAGFGCCGIEGNFRRCCEKTLQLLSDNQETLLTILEVLLCDPLYSWTVKGTLKERKPSAISVREAAAAGSGLAERALLAVRGKLCGEDGGAPGSVAVPGHVARLLQAATDPANLSRLFPGWQPYM